MKNRIAALTLLMAGLWTGCSKSDAGGSSEHPHPAATGVHVRSAAYIENPCGIFTEEIARSLGNGPYGPGTPTVRKPVAICTYMGSSQAPNIYGATVRFKRMSKQDFLASSCEVPINKDSGKPYYDVDTLEGIHEAACRFKPFGEVFVGLQVLTKSGWAINVGSAPQEKALAAIEAMIPMLPD